MFQKGYKQTKKHKNRIAIALIGNQNAIGKMLGEKHPHWKGKGASYSSKHSWIRRHFGKPLNCKKCNKRGEFINGKWGIHWANKNGKYSRNKKDWIALCINCHNKYDFKHKSKNMKLAWKIRYA